MHMADALLAPAVAATMYVASGAAATLSARSCPRYRCSLPTRPRTRTRASASAPVAGFANVNARHEQSE